MNDTWSWAWGQGLSGAPAPGTPASILSDLVTTPNGTTRHIDINSIDMYWFAGSRDPSWSGYMTLAGQYLYNLSSGMTPDQSERGSNYGDMIDILRGYQAGGHPAPIYSIIEDGDPFTGSTNGSTYITPAELNWATWSSLIHGARGIIYFDHSFSGPGTGNVGVEQSYFQTVQPGQTISIDGQITATDALVKQLAPVLNSPFALHYVTVSPAGYTYNTPTLSLSGGIEVMAKDYNGQFYIFADTRDSETQHNLPAVFTLNDPNATSVTVVNENRTISVVNGFFSDTFANASTVHIYQVNDGSSASSPPPPSAPPAPAITSFSPSTNGVDTTSSVTLNGTAEASSTVTVYDGNTYLGTATVSTGGNWTLTENNAVNGVHLFTATDTDANGTGPASSAYSVTVNVPSAVNVPPSTNLIVNGGFETGNFTGWTMSGNVAQLSIGPQLFITSSAHSGQDAAGLGSMGSDGTISQNLATVVGQSYTFDFWLANVAGGTDDFTAKIGGVTELHLVNAAAQPYTHYSYTFTATSTSTPLEFDFRQDPSNWLLDDVSVVQATQTAPQIDTTPPIPVIKSEILSNSQVTLTGTTAEAHDTISVYDGTTLLGTTLTSSSGTWSFTTGNVSSAVVHIYTVTGTDIAGNIGQSSNEAILGSSGADSLVGTSGNDIIIGRGGNDNITGGGGADRLTGGTGNETFLYNAITDSTPASHDTITDFTRNSDKIDFTNIAGINAVGGVPTFEGKLTGSGNLTLNAHSVGYIVVGGNTEVLVNTTNNAEIVTASNVSAANIEIVLVGTYLHLASTDFHHV